MLSLQYACFRRLPTLNNLLHLRYLDLSHNEYLLELPNSLENLHNLQTLKLDHCQRLKELPRGLRKLVNLKYLEISGCDSLTHMPQGISCLTSLQSLTMFVVGKTDLFKQVRVSELKGWWKSSGEQQQSLAFPRLFGLQVRNCPLLTSIPLCPNVEYFELTGFNEAFNPFGISSNKKAVAVAVAVADQSSSFSGIPTLKKLMIDNVGYLNSCHVESLQQFHYMEIQSAKLRSLST